MNCSQGVGLGGTYPEYWKGTVARLRQAIFTLSAYRTLSGHKTDVCDLAWSPDNTLLASASFDSSIIIWGTDKFGTIRSVLTMKS